MTMSTELSPLRKAQNDAWEAYSADPTPEKQLAYQKAFEAYKESPEAYRARGGMSWEAWMSS
jgi:hypothetical protein